MILRTNSLSCVVCWTSFHVNAEPRCWVSGLTLSRCWSEPRDRWSPHRWSSHWLNSKFIYTSMYCVLNRSRSVNWSTRI